MNTRNYEAVVIGASWGGTEALIDILKDIPANFPLPIIIVLHRQRNVQSYLPEVLTRYLKMEVREINEKEKIKNGVVYVAPSNYHVLIEDDRSFSLDASEEIAYSRPSIDFLFESAARIYKEKLIGIVLTGANADGSEGIRTIYEKNGLTIVQNPREAESNIMPSAALGKTQVDYIFNKKEITDFLLTL